MLRLLRDGVLSIVDEDRELSMRKVFRETNKRNLRPHQQAERKLENMSDGMQWVVLTRSKPTRFVAAIFD